MANNKLTYTDENNIECDDLLHSEESVQNFYAIITNSRYSVYAISGGWGTGKTCFVKMWENKLKEESRIFVHIDAFKMDYESEPFIMLIKAFKEFLKKINIDTNKIQAFLEKAKEAFSMDKLLKLGANVLVEKTVGVKPVKDFLNDLSNTYFDNLTDEKSLYDELITSIKEITKQFDKTVYIIIDELDRCRPDFALETLERIKHIFNVKGVKFILVYNEDVMKSIIKRKYGIETNPERYLNKFVQKKYELENTKRLTQWFKSEVDNDLERFNSSFLQFFLDQGKDIILETKRLYGLSYRDIQQIISIMKSCFDCQNEQDFAALICIELVKYIDNDEYNTIIEHVLKYREMTSLLPKLNILEILISLFIKEGLLDFNEKYILRYLANYVLSIRIP